MTGTEDHGERLRVEHALSRLENMVHAMRLALDYPQPIGLDGPQAILTTAGEIMAHVAAADAYNRASSAKVKENDR